MGKTKDLGHLAHIVAYNSENHITVPAGITMHTNQLVASQAYVTTALSSYALSSSLSSYVPTSRTITINGTTLDLSANRTFTIAAGLSSFNTRTGDVTLTSSDVTTALGFTPVTNARTITINGTTFDLSADRSYTVSAGTTLNGTGFVKASGTTITYDNSTYLTGITSTLVTNALGFTPYNATNPAGYITGITSANVTTALGFTPYNATNPAGYITSAGSITGNAATATSADNIDGWSFVNTGSNSATVPDSISSNGISYTSVSLLGQSDGALYSQAYSSSWQHQIFGDYRTGQIAIRGKNANSWQAWRTVLDSSNYTSYAAAASHQHDTLFFNGSARLWTGSDGTRNSGWAYHQDNGTGLHWPNNGWHLMPASSTDFRIHSGNSGESCLRMETNGASRGYVYVNSSNQIGFLNNERSWVFKISNDGNIVMDYNYGVSITGVYSATRYQGVWSMGNAYRLPADGTSTGNLYGMAWSHPNAGGVAGNLNDHGLLVLLNGGFAASISSSIRAAADMRAPIFYDQNDTGYYADFNSTSDSAIRLRGGILCGPNPTWGAYLQVGGNGNNTDYATVVATDGNLHMDSQVNKAMYLNYYHNGIIYLNGTTYYISSNGSYYNGTSGASNALTANATANNIYNSGWFRNYGDSGLYNQDYGCHIARNSQSSHGSWSMWGYTKAGYVGMNLQDPQGYNNNLMFEQGRGGVYQENGGGWHFYYDRPNDCLGLSGSETYDWVRACTNGKHRITNDTWCDATSWAYTFSNISDGRLKENITTVDSALDKVLQLRGVYYNWIIDTENKKHIGLIAQETAAVCPEVVNYHDETDTYSVNYSELSGLFVESTKELNQKLMDANARIELLETKLNQLLNA